MDLYGTFWLSSSFPAKASVRSIAFSEIVLLAKNKSSRKCLRKRYGLNLCKHPGARIFVEYEMKLILIMDTAALHARWILKNNKSFHKIKSCRREMKLPNIFLDKLVPNTGCPEIFFRSLIEY